MAKKFPNLIFKKNEPFRSKENESSFKPWNQGNSSARGFKKGFNIEKRVGNVD